MLRTAYRAWRERKPGAAPPGREPGVALGDTVFAALQVGFYSTLLNFFNFN